MQSPSNSRWPNTAIVITIVLGLLLLIFGGWAVVGAVRISQVNAQLAAVRSDLDDARERIASLEDELAAANSSGGILGDLFGGGNGGSLGLEDLLGLLGGNAQGLQGLQDLLGGLLGGESGNFGDPGGSLGGLDPAGDLGSCLGAATGRFEIRDGTLEAQVDDIALAVEDLRGLRFPSSVEPSFVTTDEMAERMRSLLEEGYPPDLADFDTRLLVALGMLSPGYDLVAGQLDLLDSGVAGYYDPVTNELIVATRGSNQPLAPVDQITLAHEMIHALTDARLGFPDAIENPRADPDVIRAQQALIEGDATLGMHQFSMGALGFEEQLAIMMDPRLLGALHEAGEFPYVLSNGAQLPYFEGMNFTCSLFADGGWQAVDAAYDDPPTNTAQILFPERYRDRIEAIDPASPGSPGSGWESLGQVGFGAVDLLMLFSAPGDDPGRGLSDARQRVGAWGGGEAEVWSRGSHTVVAIGLVDIGDRSGPLCDSMVSWELAAFPEHSRLDQAGSEQLVHAGTGRAAVVVCEGSDVRIGIGPDLEVARTVAAGRS